MFNDPPGSRATKWSANACATLKNRPRRCYPPGTGWLSPPPCGGYGHLARLSRGFCTKGSNPWQQHCHLPSASLRELVNHWPQSLELVKHPGVPIYSRVTFTESPLSELEHIDKIDIISF
jgi:hypothetical protein